MSYTEYRNGAVQKNKQFFMKTVGVLSAAFGTSLIFISPDTAIYTILFIHSVALHISGNRGITHKAYWFLTLCALLGSKLAIPLALIGIMSCAVIAIIAAIQKKPIFVAAIWTVLCIGCILIRAAGFWNSEIVDFIEKATTSCATIYAFWQAQTWGTVTLNRKKQ